jgi:hypothetical protein
VEISPLSTSATTGLLYLPRVTVMMMVNLVEWRLAGETEVLGENLPRRHFVHYKPRGLEKKRPKEPEPREPEKGT